MLPFVKLWINFLHKTLFKISRTILENLLCLKTNISFQIQIYVSNVYSIENIWYIIETFFYHIFPFSWKYEFPFLSFFQSSFFTFHNWSSLVMFSDYFSPQTIYITTHLLLMFFVLHFSSVSFDGKMSHTNLGNILFQQFPAKISLCKE